MASKSAEAEDVDLYIANIQGEAWTREESGVYEAYMADGREWLGLVGTKHALDT